jgi:uncharacterized membrane protein (UPF0127 family)
MLINARTGETIAAAVELADTRRRRRKGLLGRASMAPSSALILLPCFSIHTAFMRFAIDAIFVDKDGIVVRVERRMGPWRAAASWQAHSVIELPAGWLDDHDVVTGDRLYLARGESAGNAA